MGAGKIEYAIRGEDCCGSYGYKTFEDARNWGCRNASMWVSEHGGECVLELLKVETVGVIRVRYDGLRSAETIQDDKTKGE